MKKTNLMGTAIVAVVLASGCGSSKVAEYNNVGKKTAQVEASASKIGTPAAGERQGATAKGNRTVEYPLIEMANTHAVDIVKVELADTATILHIDANYWPRHSITIDSKSYLRAGGKKYMLVGAEGITPGSRFRMPDSGKASFTLRFEPLPYGTQAFDFIASDCEDCFKLFGIDLTGKYMFEAPEGVPADLLKYDDTAEVPDPIFKTGRTTVNIHFMHYRPEMGKEVELIVNNIFGKQKLHTLAIDPGKGEASLSFMQYGTAEAFIVLNNASVGGVWLAPGETTELYVDLRSIGYSRLLRNSTKKASLQPFRQLYSSGTYANINNVCNILDNSPYYGMELLSGEFADYRMTSAEYSAHVVNTYKALADSIARSNLSPLMKKMETLALQRNALEAMASGNYIREHNYRYKNNQRDRSVKVEGIEPLKPEDAKAVCRLFDINNLKLLIGKNIRDYIGAVCSPSFDWPKLAGISKGPVKDLRQVSGYQAKAENIELTEADFAKLKAMDTPFYFDAFSQIQQKNKDELAALGAKAKTETTPDVAVEQLFDAIITPHKGKVVLVDFWNTWCGPCCSAIEHTEPLKSSSLKNDSIVWIYIANETSPLVKYMTMIPNIKGLHYRLNSKQWKYICDKFKITGIPAYVLVDKSGKYELRDDLRDHKKLEKTLKEEAARRSGL